MNGPNPSNLFLAMDAGTKHAVERRIQYLKDKIASLKVCINDYTINTERYLTKHSRILTGRANRELAKGLVRIQVKDWKDESTRALKELIPLRAIMEKA